MTHLKTLPGTWNKASRDALPKAIAQALDTYVQHGYTPIKLRRDGNYWKIQVEYICHMKSDAGVRIWLHWKTWTMNSDGMVIDTQQDRYDYWVEPYPGTEPQPPAIDPDELAKYRKRKAKADDDAKKAEQFDQGDRVGNSRGGEGTVEEIKDGKVYVRWDATGRRRGVKASTLMKV